jgi:hypothetical protein
LQVEGILFKLDLKILMAQSEPIKQIFGIPASEDDGKQEGTEERPIILEGISQSDFQGFVHWLYHL